MSAIDNGRIGARRPPWLRKQRLFPQGVLSCRGRISDLGLHTVCESARCPNLTECFQRGNATFLILGESCTRNCGFCAVPHGDPSEPDPAEGEKIASFASERGISYCVITSVTRDDLPDGGASHFIRVVRDLRRLRPSMRIEVLVPDFRGSRRAVDAVTELDLAVFGHNVETVPSLYPRLRSGAAYARSLEVLRWAGRKEGGFLLKTGLMAGLGEGREELAAVFRDCAGAGVEILTIGQYLQPSARQVPVARYLPPVEFEDLADLARACGIPHPVSGPYVRSSYLAERTFLAGKTFDKGEGAKYNSK
jgi:lipoyl synthase